MCPHLQLLLALWYFGFLSSIFGQCWPDIFSLIFFFIRKCLVVVWSSSLMFYLLAIALALEVSASFHLMYPAVIFSTACYPIFSFILAFFFERESWCIIFTDSLLLVPKPFISFSGQLSAAARISLDFISPWQENQSLSLHCDDTCEPAT